MKKFAYIENNEVEKIGELPINFKTISNFFALENDLEALKQHGWLPVETVNENKPVYVSTEYVIEENVVKEIINTREQTQEEIDKIQEQELEGKWSKIRTERNSLLIQSDTKIVVDKWEDMSDEKKSEWKKYRKDLRDIPQNFNNPDNIIWPTIPE